MSFLARRAAAFRPAAAVAPRRGLHSTARRLDSTAEQKAALSDESKRNPEVFILGAIMVAAFAGAGYYFGRSPTSNTSEAHVAVAEGGMPWQQGADAKAGSKYAYHPGADPSRAPKEAPSALNSTVIPDVTLPKHLHDAFNKWGKEDA